MKAKFSWVLTVKLETVKSNYNERIVDVLDYGRLFSHARLRKKGLELKFGSVIKWCLPQKMRRCDFVGAGFKINSVIFG